MRNLRNNYNALVQKKVPTGDPDCPPLVRRAKRINSTIKERAQIIERGTRRNQETDESSGLETPVGLSSSGEFGSSVLSSNNKTNRDFKEDARNKLIEAFVESEKAQAKRERRYERREEKRARREDRRRHNERQENFKFFMGTVTSLARAFGGKEIDGDSVFPGGTSSKANIKRSAIGSSGSSSDSDSSTESSTLSRLRSKSKTLVNKIRVGSTKVTTTNNSNSDGNTSDNSSGSSA